VVGEAEVVVGAEVEDFAAGDLAVGAGGEHRGGACPPCYGDVGLLGGGEDALGFVEALVAELLELRGEMGLEAGVGAHGVVSAR
jgi:hypothetical protein